MKIIHLSALISVFTATLAACSGSGTQAVDYGNVDTTPKLDMKAAIYQAQVPSGTLTLTVDQDGTRVAGAYTIKNGPTIVSSGVISNLTTNLTLEADNNSPCFGEAMSIVTSNISANTASISISGRGCTESTTLQNITTTSSISKITPADNKKMLSRATTAANETISIEVVSADDVNFVGTVSLSNPALTSPASGTIVAKIKSDLATNTPAVNITALNAKGFTFDRVNFKGGHFFDAGDRITNISGQIETAPTPGGQYSISRINVQVDNNGVNQPISAISNHTVLLGYTPLFP